MASTVANNFPKIDLRTLAIAFDPPGSYFSGNMVTGRVILESAAKQPQAVMRFELNCTGKMVVEWEESRRRGDPSHNYWERATCHAGENFFQFQILMGDIVPGGPGFWLHPGIRCEYPFAFQLPPGLLSSFEPSNYSHDEYGYVRYNVQALVNNQEVNSPFSVNQILDLNAFTGADVKALLKKSKQLCCLCCRNGLIYFVAKLERAGYVPGEVLELTVEMSNKSRTRVQAIRIKIVREVEFYAPVCIGTLHVEEHEKHQKNDDLIALFEGEGLAPGKTGTYRPGPSDKIPSTPPTDLGRPTNINIRVQYKVKIELVLPCGYMNLDGEMPIMIGTVPFRKNFPELTTTAGTTDDSSKPPLIPAFPDLPPVTFESTFLPSKDVFTPKYATYGGGISGKKIPK